MEDKLKSLYVDMPSWGPGIKPDDFLVAVGVNKTNSVYHVYSVREKPRPEKRAVRYYVKVFKSELITALRREPGQRVITLVWYKRKKKNEKKR